MRGVTLKGALIGSVLPGSPAQEAGIKRGDIVLEYDGRKIEDPFDLSAYVAQTQIGKKIALNDLLRDFKNAKGLLVVFMCNHCPYVEHIKKALAAFAREVQPKGLAMVGINSNDVKNYPEDSPQQMAKEVKEFGYTFPYLYDESQNVRLESGSDSPLA